MNSQEKYRDASASHPNDIKVLPARLIDAKLFYDLRYLPEAIKYSKTKTIPDYQAHIKWFNANYKNNFFTIFYNNIGVGYIRINLDNEISIAISPEYHRKGIAKAALTQIVVSHPGLYAEIYEDNMASIKLFNQFPAIKVKILQYCK